MTGWNSWKYDIWEANTSWNTVKWMLEMKELYIESIK